MLLSYKRHWNCLLINTHAELKTVSCCFCLRFYRLSSGVLRAVTSAASS